MDKQEKYFHLYLTALRASHNQSIRVEDWGANSAEMALKLMPYADSSAIPASAPSNMPGVVAEAAGAQQQSHSSGGGLGPAFRGWPEAELRVCLMSIQQIVLAHEYGATEEAFKHVNEELNASVMAVVTARAAMKIKK